MRYARILRHAAVLVGGLVLLFPTGCTSSQFFEFLSTAFLGVTAAASYAVLQNI
ncbi:MAG: hypothetical protein V2A79_06680 [Planctomycetota bacterium]